MLRDVFQGGKNWLLRGLYFLSKDLFDDAFADTAEPDAQDLAGLRHALEHRFVSLLDSDRSDDTEAHRMVGVRSVEAKALRLLKMAREALIYLSLAMHQEEKRRKAARGGEGAGGVPVFRPGRIDSFRRKE